MIITSRSCLLLVSWSIFELRFRARARDIPRSRCISSMFVCSCAGIETWKSTQNQKQLKREEKRNISRVHSSHWAQYERFACIEIRMSMNRECGVLLPNQENVRLSVWFRLSFLFYAFVCCFRFLFQYSRCWLLYFFLFFFFVVVVVVVVRSVGRSFVLSFLIIVFVILCIEQIVCRYIFLEVNTLLLQLCSTFFVLVLSLFRRSISLAVFAVSTSLSVYIMLSSLFLPYFCCELQFLHDSLCLPHTYAHNGSMLNVWANIFFSERYSESARRSFWPVNDFTVKY